MAASRYPLRQLHTHRRRLTFIELSLALSVIVGLLFVSARIMTMGLPPSWTQTGTVVVKTEKPLATDTPDTKTP